MSAAVREIYACGTLHVREGPLKYLEVKLKSLASVVLIVIKHCTFNFRS